MQSTNVKRLTQMAILIAMEIILSRFLSISTPIVKIGFAFLPVTLMAMRFGPWYAAFGYAAGDFIGAILFPIGAYFPGFTLTAFLSGLTYGYALYRKPRSLWSIIIGVTVVAAIWQLGLNSVWLSMITGKGVLALMPARILKCIAIIPIEVILIRLMSQYEAKLFPTVQGA